VIGCDDDDDDDDDSASTAPSAPSAPEKTISFTESRRNKPPSMDVNSTALAPAEFFAVYDPLTRLEETPNGTTPKPALAESWETDANKNWVFHLREAEWSDGTPFTAEDVKFTFEYYSDAENGSRLISRVNTVETTTALDGRTVQVSNKGGVDPIMPRRAALPFILPKHIYTDASIDVKEFMAATPVGTGSYAVSNFTADSFVEFEASANSWRGNRGVTAGSTIWIEEATTQLAAFETGDVHMLTGIPSPEVDRVRGFNGVSLAAANALGAQHWDFSNRRSEGHPLLDKRARQALALAIDSKSIAEVVYQGLADEAHGQITHKASFGYDPTLKPNPFDPDQARQLLKDAGFSSGFDVQMDSRMDGDTKPMVEATAGFWDEIGINTSIVPLEINVWRDRLYGREGKKWPGAFNAGWVAYLYDAGFLYDWYEGAGGAYRIWDADDPTQLQFDEFYRAALVELDDAKRAGFYNDIAKLFSLDGEAPVASTFYVNALDGWRSDMVSNFTPAKFPELRFDELIPV
jgi:peptide/nickel transport system substrate-binding protein